MIEILACIIAILFLVTTIFYFNFFKISNLSIIVPITIFVIKAVASLFNLYFHFYIINGDCLIYFHEAASKNILLGQSFNSFLIDLKREWMFAPDTYNFLSRATRFWEILGNSLLMRLLSIFHLLSFGKPFAVTIWYCFLPFVGQWAIFKTLAEKFPNAKWLLIFSLFLIPTTLFYTSGIHKDGLIVFGLGLFIRALVSFGSNRKIKHLIIMIGCVILIFLVRNFIILTIIPSALLYLISLKHEKNAPKIFISAALLAFVCIMLSSFISEQKPLNIYAKIAERQSEFLKLKQENTFYSIPKLKNNINNLPKSILVSLKNNFVSPTMKEAKSVFQKMVSLENLILLCILSFSMLYYQNVIIKDPLIQLLIFIAMSNILFIGISVPYVGAIIRYKAIYTTLLFSVSVIFISYKKENFIVNQLFTYIKNKNVNYFMNKLKKINYFFISL